jgi:hypothetical protein
MLKFLRKAIIAIFALLLIVVLVVKFQTRDRHPGYKLDLKIGKNNPGQIRAGFAAISITPEIVDTWNDVDGNARYEPKKGDTFNDNNGNGKFDAFWLAGFQNRRAANGVHDSIWARTVIIEDGTSRIALVSLDAIGFFHDQVVEVRKRLPKNLGIDYCMIAATHVHETPDLMGIWGSSEFRNGVNKDYLEWVINQTVKSVESAVLELEPVSLHFSMNEDDAVHLVTDTRKPIVHDPGIYIIQAKREDGSTKGTMVSWANHPETLWNKNLLITSDFPHFFRKGIEEASGGICVYFNGAIGGLITTHPSVPIIHPETGEEILKPGFDKAEAQGMILAGIALTAMQNSTDSITHGAIGLRVKTFTLPFKNKLFRLAAAIGVLDRGMTGWWKVRTEMAAFTIGPASFLTIPGEIYPEIVNGGIEAPEGQDFKISPVEVPPLRDLMPGKFKFVIGMANDELGYFIPKSQWDHKAPWLYNAEKETYGEINSLGPETAPLIHRQASEIILSIMK